MTTIGVVGAGTMGAGIAQVALEAGDDVLLYDVDAAAVDGAVARIRVGLARSAARLDLDADSIDDWVDGRIDGLHTAATLHAVAGAATVVIEAALEDLGTKRSVFGALDGAAGPTTILATNTSALSVAAIAAATSRPDRVLGLHFFNPVPRMPLVEVVLTETTDPAVADASEALVTAWGKTPVRCADTPGFIVNRVNRPFTIEALRLLEAGDASVEAIDAAMRDGGFPMGPFELMDLIGIDVNLAAATSVWEGLGRPDRLRPSPIQEGLVAAGRLGRKTGDGFYRYEDSRPTAVAIDAPVSGALRAEAIRARIVDAIADEARRAAAEGIATPADIELALRLGAGHPETAAGNRSA